MKKWMFAASVEMRPRADNSGIVLFDSCLNQTHLLRFTYDANHASTFSPPFTSDEFSVFFGAESGTLDVLVSRKLVIPFEH
ncbi:MAG: hypothetical protein VX066_12945 [Pseudomonadota bacterium]|nr:hypothetical protein [Pseudomonadota bacterium]